MKNNNTYSGTEPLEVINLPQLPEKILINNGVKTVGKFFKLKRSRLIKIKGIAKVRNKKNNL